MIEPDTRPTADPVPIFGIHCCGNFKLSIIFTSKQFTVRILIAFLFLLLATPSFAAKTFRYCVTVFSMNQQPLEGMIVRLTKKDGTKLEANTDQLGQVLFTELREKDYVVMVNDPGGSYRETKVNYYNPKRENDSNEVSMRYSQEKETALILSKTKQFTPESTGSKIDCDTSNQTSAEFPGGNKEFMIYIMNNMVFPEDVVKNGGKVYIQFVIEKDGNITNIQIVRGVNPSIDAEAIRLIAYMPNWIPASCNGEPVKARARIPLSFIVH